MTKLKALLSTAAALILTGLGVGVAINQAGVTHDVTTEQWCSKIQQVNDVQRKERFFIAIQQGATIPKAAGDRVLGDCAAGVCTIAPEAAPDCAYTYTYDLGPLVNGWRIAEVWAHPYVAKGWLLAADAQADLRWYASLGQVVGECLEHFTASECKTLLDVDGRCWVWDTDPLPPDEDDRHFAPGDRCRYGGHMGADEPCAYNYPGEMKASPCTVYRGAGSEDIDSAREFTPEEMDEM